MKDFLMENQFRGKYRTTSFRRPNWDYGSHGLYFITICTQDRIHYFGKIEQHTTVETQDFVSLDRDLVSLSMTEIAKIAYQNWLSIPEHFPFVELDEFVLMPNHLHGILFINKPEKMDWEFSKFGAQSRNLPSIIRGYKAAVKKYATINNIDFMWQPRYHDRVIRDEKEYWNIKDYIANNIPRWSTDPDNILLP